MVWGVELDDVIVDSGGDVIGCGVGRRASTRSDSLGGTGRYVVALNGSTPGSKQSAIISDFHSGDTGVSNPPSSTPWRRKPRPRYQVGEFKDSDLYHEPVPGPGSKIHYSVSNPGSWCPLFALITNETDENLVFLPPDFVAKFSIRQRRLDFSHFC